MPGVPGEGEREHQAERPEQVELLLDGQRPEVDEQQRRGAVEVARPRCHLDPVGGEGQRAESLPTDGDEQVAPHQSGGADAHHDDGQQGGQQPAGATQPELRQVDPSTSADLAQQQSGDQEAGDDEEDVDAEEATG